MEDLDADFDFTGAINPPCRIDGRGQTVYWQDCKPTLYRKTDDGKLERVKPHNSSRGKGRLSDSEALLFVGEGGMVIQR